MKAKSKFVSVLTIVFLAVTLLVPGSVLAAETAIYDSIPDPLPPNLPSLGYQATQTSELGDHIIFAGTERVLNSVTVTMSNWALNSTYPDMEAAGFTHPITLNIYEVEKTGITPAVGTLITSLTQDFLIPWRPEADPTCPGGTAWRASNGNCYNGYAVNIVFDFSTQSITLPDEIIYGLAYNTNTWGADPIGENGPYESLNFALSSANAAGTNVDPDDVFWNTETAAWYADGGTGGVGIFRRDTNWAGYVPAIRFNVDDQGPITTNVIASQNPAAVNNSVAVTANVHDASTGGSNIASAEYSLDGGSTWSPMTATDGAFDDVSEDITANFTAPSTPDIYDLCVRGTDVPGNVGAPECIMFVVYDPNGGFVTGGGWIDSPAGAVAPTTVYFNGFETDIDGWDSPIRVISGTNGITSASGDYYAEATTDFTRWGGYNSVFPAGGYITSIDIYLDMNGGFANDTRFDWTSAVSTPANTHRRDFIFNGGFYNDATGPGAGQNRFVFSASNNAPGWPKNPGRDPFAVTTTGWYTLQHLFYDSGSSVLAVEMSILDSSGTVLHTWTLSDPSDVIGTMVGGNRYGWFAYNYFPILAVDNSLRKEFSTVAGKATFGFVSKYRRGATVPEGNTEFQFKSGNLNFSSTSYQWLVVNQGGTNAQFKGFGTINGTGNYGFMLWSTDGAPDTFRIKIWDAATEAVVYDNGADQAIGGGSIVIHRR
jgi:hypothetical protein